MRCLRLAIVSALILTGTGCSTAPAVGRTSPTDAASTSANRIYSMVQAGDLTDSGDIPAPQGEVVLTLTGAISKTNVGNTLALDLATLERVGLIEYRMNDVQAEGREARFRGVLLRDLLDLAGVSPAASTLHFIALNDYAIDIPVSDVRSMPVMVATSVDGQRMTVDRFGPTRVIYPMDQLKLDRAQYDARLIWQLDRIDVR